MGRPKKVTVEIPDEDFREPTREELELDAFLEKFGADTTTLKVYRQPTRGAGSSGQPLFVEIVNPADLDEDIMRERYGAGTYVLKFYDSNSQYVASKRVYIDNLKAGGPAPSSSSNGQGDMLSFMRDQLASQQTLMLGLISAMVQGGNRGPDIGQLMSGMGALLGAVKPPAPVDPASIMTTIIGAVSTLTPKTGDDWLDKMAKVMDIAQGIQPRNDDSLLGVARDIGSKVVDAFASPRHPEMEQARIVEARPAIPPGATPVSTNSEKSQEELMWEWLRVQLQYLKTKAAAGKDVEFQIDAIFENDEEPGNRAILQAIERGARIEHLIQFDPEIGNNRVLLDWFTRFYNGIHEGLREGREPEPEPARPEPKAVDPVRKGRDTSDTTDHAGPGPEGLPGPGGPGPDYGGSGSD